MMNTELAAEPDDAGLTDPARYQTSLQSMDSIRVHLTISK